jgi:antiviral helicase SLH1
MITLLQCIKCARWPTENPLSILPGIVIDDKRKNLPTTLMELSSLPLSKLQALPNSLSLANYHKSAFLKAAQAIPNLKIKVPSVTALSITVSLNRLNTVTEREARIYAPHFPKPQSEGWFVIVANSGNDDIIAVKRIGWSTPGKSGSVAVGSRPNASAVIKLPEPDDVLGMGIVAERKVDILVISDGYLGMVYKIEGVEIPAPPMVVDEGKKSKVPNE